MAEEALQVIRLRNDFLRDGFKKIMISLIVVVTAIVLLIGTSIYLYVSKPLPVYFKTDNEWRTLLPVPEKLAYLNTFSLLQWVSNTFQNVFKYDFLNYKNQLQANREYFTENGWTVFSSIVNKYVTSQSLVDNRLFMNGFLHGAPYVTQEGVLNNVRYGWWVRVPMSIKFQGLEKSSSLLPEFDVLVVRVSTLNNIYGVAIENMTLAPNRQQS